MVATASPSLMPTLHALASQPRALVPIAIAVKLLRLPKQRALDRIANLESECWVSTFEDDGRLFVILTSQAAATLGIELEPADVDDPREQRWVPVGRSDHHRADGFSDIVLETDASPEPTRSGILASLAASEPEPDRESDEEPIGSNWTGSDFYGSSDDYSKWLRRERPWLIAPEREIVPCLKGWDGTASHRANPGRCPKCSRGYRRGKPRYCAGCDWCAHCGGGFDDGSLLYCPECHRSGFDDRLGAQLRIVGVPPRRPAYAVSEATRSKIGRVASQVLSKARGVTFSGSAASPGSARPTRKARRAAKFAHQPTGAMT